MKLIKPFYTILEQKPGLEGIYEAIETAGRCCYKSKRPEGKTAKDFVDMLIKNKHYAMLEAGTVYLKIPVTTWSYLHYSGEDSEFDFDYYPDHHCINPYSKMNIEGDFAYITTNMRVLQEHNWLDDLQYLCEPTEFHEKRVTVHFTTSIGIGREFLRHRTFSFANESTRYCNYSSEKKFGSEITFIEPSWFDKNACTIDLTKYSTIETNYFPEYDYKYFEEISGKPTSKEDMFIWSLLVCEKAYLDSIKLGAVPQQAREVLPLATKSELIITGFISDWEHFFDLRAKEITGKAHPDAKALAEPLMQEFINRGYIQ